MDQNRPDWPAGFFDARLTKDDLATLREAGTELEDAIYAARRDRPVPPL